MNQFITMEVNFFLVSIAWGVILFVLYDCLRIFRKVVDHGVVMLSLEDIVYWTISAVLIFRMMYRFNNGVIRGFSMLGILLGMVTYKYTISEYVVRWISIVLIKIKDLFIRILHIISKPARLLFGGMQKWLKRLWLTLCHKFLPIRNIVQNWFRSIRKALQTHRKRVKMKKEEKLKAKKNKRKQASDDLEEAFEQLNDKKREVEPIRVPYIK